MAKKESNVPAPDMQVQIGAEFSALPLEFIIAAPLIGAVAAQASAAKMTVDFIKSMIEDGSPITVDFKVQSESQGDTTTKKNFSVSAPLLSIVPVPHLRIDSITTHFRYEVTQVVSHEKGTEKGASIELGAGSKILSLFTGTLKGNISSHSKDSSTLNRSGMLEITVNASEAPMPEGLAKILNLLASSIPAPVPEK